MAAEILGDDVEKSGAIVDVLHDVRSYDFLDENLAVVHDFCLLLYALLNHGWVRQARGPIVLGSEPLPLLIEHRVGQHLLHWDHCAVRAICVIGHSYQLRLLLGVGTGYLSLLLSLICVVFDHCGCK